MAGRGPAAPVRRAVEPHASNREPSTDPARVYRGRVGYVAHEDAGGEPPWEWSGLAAKVRANRTTIGALALIVASLIWKGVFLSHFSFRQDDFWLMDIAAKKGLSGQYIFRVWAGQFIPGAYVLGWLQVKIALYSWTVGAGIELALIAVASLTAWRLLRTLLGNRPAILIPLALYVLSPVAFQSYSWWISAVETVPLQIAIFASLEAHIRYVWTQRLRHAILAAAWLAFGLFFFEKAALIPVLLFAVTAGFLIPGQPLLSAVRTAVVRFWRAWLLYLAVLAAYAAVFVPALRRSQSLGGTPPSSRTIVTFTWDLIFHTLVPSVLGGPWHWFTLADGADAGSSPPEALAWLALIVALTVVVASILARKRAWRGWLILVGWLAIDDVLPVVIGRLTLAPSWAALLALATRYVDDLLAVLIVVVALVFWPIVTGRQEEAGSARRRHGLFPTGPWRKAVAALLAVFVVGSVWSVTKLMTQTTVVASSYVANARQALAQVPPGTVIVDTKLPNDVMLGVYGHASDASVVLAPLTPKTKHVVWATEPTGTPDKVMIFGPDGKLYAAEVAGATGQSASVFANCLTPKRSRLTVPLPVSSAVVPWVRVLQVTYLADHGAAGTSLAVRYGHTTGHITLAFGAHNAYLPVTGGASAITLELPLSSGAFCFEKTFAGYIVPAPGTGIPRA